MKLSKAAWSIGIVWPSISSNEDRLGDLGALCASDIRYIIRGHGPLAGEYHGIEAFAGALRRVKQLTNGTMAVTPEVLVEGGDALMYASQFVERDLRQRRPHIARSY